MKNINGLFIALLFLLSIVGSAAGAAAVPIHALELKPYSAATPAPDKITITGTENHVWTNPGSLKDTTFYLPHGTYDLTIEKTGYNSWTMKGVSINDDFGPVRVLSYDLTPIPASNNGSTNGGSSGTSTGTSTDLYVNDLDFKDKVYPGDTVTFKMEVDAKEANTYTAKHVEAKLTVKNLNDGEDVTSEISIGSMDAGDSTDETFTIEIPAQVDADTYKVTVDLKWEDASGKQQIAKYPATGNTVELEVAKQKHQVLITDTQEDLTSYKAGDTVQIAVSMVNTGSNDETVKVTLASDVGVQTTSATFTLKQGDTSTQYLNFVVPENTKSGKYYTVISVVYGSVSTIQRFILTVDGITAVQPQSTVTVVQPAEETKAPIPTTEIALGAIVLILAGIIAWFGKDAMSKGAAKPLIIKARGK
jgi:hypothetical protein